MCICVSYSFVFYSSSKHFSAAFQTEIAKRLNVICAQLIPFLSQEVTHTHTRTAFIPFIVYLQVQSEMSRIISTQSLCRRVITVNLIPRPR